MAFLGMRGTGQWPANARPESWRETILRLYPNGATTLTGIMAMLGSRRVDDPHFHWFEQMFPEQEGPVAGVFTDAALTQAYAGAGLAQGDVVFAQISAELLSHFRFGHQVMLEKDGDLRYETRGKVVGRVEAGASSYLAIKLIESSRPDYDLDEVDWVSLVSDSSPEGATMPDSIMYDPEEYDNYTQIFRTSLSITRTAQRTRLRYGTDEYKRAKLECLEQHAIGMERQSIWGEKSFTIGHNNQPERTSRGIIPSIREFAPENIVDYRLDPEFAGMTWEEGGEAWINKIMAQIQTYGADEKLVLHGSGAGLGLQKLVRAGVEMGISAGQTVDYGITVRKWMSNGLTLNLKSHPLFNIKRNYSDAMLIFEPNRLQFNYIDDTQFISDPQDKKNRNNSKDATDEEYLTEGGFEFSFPRTAMLASGIGKDNTLTP